MEKTTKRYKSQSFPNPVLDGNLGLKTRMVPNLVIETKMYDITLKKIIGTKIFKKLLKSCIIKSHYVKST